MTDEEKAEEYVSPKVWGDTYYINCCGDWSNEEMKKAYLDGLTEGRKEKFHDLRKDPNDLPKRSGEYWCYDEYVGYKEHRKVYYDGDIWCASGVKVIAWYELPEFEE